MRGDGPGVAEGAKVEAGAAAPGAITKASCYALGLLAFANFLNYLDRSIFSILAEAIKTDLRLDDAQLGFLLGTAFAIFYSIVGIAMGGISDRLSRKKVMAIGLALWSSMTMLGGAATNLLTLGIARLGVGIGEATANPCSHSLVSQIFPRRNRSLALSTYLTGAYVGGAASMIVGGYMLQHWSDGLCASVPIAGACSLAAWKAALLTVGLPGLPVALLVLTIREPARPRRDERGTLSTIVDEFSTVIPPFTLIGIQRSAGTAGLLSNFAIAAAIALVAGLIAWATGDKVQWIALGIGAYSVITWGQIRKYRDLPFFRLTYGDRSFLLLIVGTSLLACIIGTVSTWSAPYLMRTYSLSPVQIGLALGLTHTLGTVIGLISGGWLVDRWKARNPGAPILMCLIALFMVAPALIAMLLLHNVTAFIIAYGVLSIFSSFWSGGIAATVQDLVTPRMRGAASSCYSLVVTIIMSGLGPYWVGRVSKMTGSLETGLLSILLLAPFALVTLILLLRALRVQTPERREAMAAAAGEPVTAPHF